MSIWVLVAAPLGLILLAAAAAAIYAFVRWLDRDKQG
jgi:hypothetical protein